MKPSAPHRHRLASVLAATLALLTSVPVHAEVPQRDPMAMVAVADLGNHALQQIRRELARALPESARPQLPPMPTPTLPASTNMTLAAIAP